MNEYVIKTEDIIHNINVIKDKAQTDIIGVLKADGYGLGAEYLASVLKKEGITSFAVTEVDDIEKLKNVLEDTDDLLIMRSTCIKEEAEIIVKNNCIATVGSEKSAEILDKCACENGVRCLAHIKIDTGLSRFGFKSDETDKIIEIYNKYPNIDFVGIYTHFSSAFNDTELTGKQLSSFLDTVDKLRKANIDVGTVHAASSPALFNVDGTALDKVRIGSAFTGRLIAKNDTGLIKIGVLQSPIIEIKRVPKGTAVGYSGSFVTKRDTTIAIVPVGHFDGFGLEREQEITGFVSLLRRMLSPVKKVIKKDCLTVRTGGKTARVIGTVGLTNCAVDITDLDVDYNDTVEIDISPIMVNKAVKRKYI